MPFPKEISLDISASENPPLKYRYVYIKQIIHYQLFLIKCSFEGKTVRKTIHTTGYSI